ncbi:CidA/LrgA family protein [Pseudobacillus badius]|uniref:CidA/LrgA family protein n=1 Tax=Bacillus badius TaxID=1455 RepID=UPI0007B3B8F7|nr:CidA/LrgA family protein [Bacillus badius]KZR57982.1 murein hydrolase regulator LrgA [Bacillus badius]
MKNSYLFVAQISFLWLIYQFGLFISEFFHLPVPGNVVGMIILFLLLSLNIVKVGWVEKGAQFLNKHLAFFFVPIAVGLMTYTSLLKESGLALAVMLLGSSIIGMALTGGVAQLLSSRHSKKEKGEDASEHPHSI